MRKAYRGHEFEALKMRYEDQVQLLRELTKLDLQIFSGYLTLQIALGGWLIAHPLDGLVVKCAMLSIDASLAGIAWLFLHRQSKRRNEAVRTIKNLNEAFGFTTDDLYLQKGAINPEAHPGSFKWPYLVGILLCLIGIGLIIFNSIVRQSTSGS